MGVDILNFVNIEKCLVFVYACFEMNKILCGVTKLQKDDNRPYKNILLY